MRQITAIVVLVGGLALTASAASAQNWGRPQAPARGVCFYENDNFNGRYFCSPVGSTTELVPLGINDRISSIRVFGRAEVTVFRDQNFRGQSRTFTSSVQRLRAEGFNDRISSFRIDSPGYGRRTFGNGEGFWGRPEVPRNGACFYKERNFGGEYFCSSAGAAVALVPRGTNDQISSIRMFGNVQVTAFVDSDYRGQTRTFDSDLRDLRRSGWDNRLSSYRVEPIRQGRGRNEGNRQGGFDRPGDQRSARQQAEAIVARAYREAFDRDPDPGAQGWVDAVMKNNWTQQQLVNELKNTPEYRLKRRATPR